MKKGGYMETSIQAYFPKLEVLGLKIGDGKKKVFVQDKTSNKPLPPPPEPAVEEPVVIDLPKKKSREWSKMTARKYVLTVLYDNPMSTRDLAWQYIKDGHSNKPLKKVQATMSVTISVLRKEGHPIVKIKAGRYGIRKKD